MSEVTRILREIRDGKEESAAQLLSLVYTEPNLGLKTLKLTLPCREREQLPVR
jgi:hypothetical protein